MIILVDIMSIIGDLFKNRERSLEKIGLTNISQYIYAHYTLRTIEKSLIPQSKAAKKIGEKCLSTI